MTDDTDRWRALDVAVNEVEIAGLEVTGDGAIDVRLHANVLPTTGPLDPDPRRVLRLTGVSEAVFWYCQEVAGAFTESQPLVDLAAVEAVFASIVAPGNQHGWRFFDVDDAGSPPSSLRLAWPRPPGVHTFDWSNQCAVQIGPDVTHRVLEGLVRFDDVVVLNADDEVVAEKEFTDGARRWWHALHARDPRMSTESQEAARATARLWREWR